MSIVLKTDPNDMRIVTDNRVGVFMSADSFNRLVHDANCARAMQTAIEECQVAIVSHWINKRAAANLARMLGEGK